MEYLLDEISFTACDKGGETYQVNAKNGHGDAKGTIR